MLVNPYIFGGSTPPPPVASKFLVHFDESPYVDQAGATLSNIFGGDLTTRTSVQSKFGGYAMDCHTRPSSFYATPPAPIDLSGSTRAATIHGWAWSDSFSGSGRGIFDTRYGASTIAIPLYFDGSGLLVWYGSPGGTIQNTTRQSTLNSWSHWCVTRDGSTGDTYIGIDGDLDYVGNFAWGKLGTFSVGSHGGGAPFVGYLDEFEILDTCLFTTGGAFGGTYTVPSAPAPPP